MIVPTTPKYSTLLTAGSHQAKAIRIAQESLELYNSDPSKIEEAITQIAVALLSTPLQESQKEWDTAVRSILDD